MAKQWTTCLSAAAVLSGAAVFDDWLTTYIPSLPWRVALMLCFALVAGCTWPSFAVHWRAQPSPSEEPSMTENAQVATEIRLALEHLRSVSALLDISETHRQPLPHAVPLNLRLVIKHLEKAINREGAVEASAVDATYKRPIAAAQ